MRIYATEQLGPTQSLTPEGYLLCESVPIARTGTQLYAAHELPFLEAGVDGLITVIREESDVFRPETIASFEGKSVTIRHNFVDPENWGEVTKGTVQNVRRSSYEPDLLLADLLITDAEAIEKVKTKTDEAGRVLELPELREVSCGYDADYEQDRPGVAYQRNIVGNHVALVERGRAGPRCAIQDEEPEIMTKKTQLPTLVQRLLRAVRSKDQALIARTADEAAEELEAEEKRVADEERAEEMRAKDEEIETLKKTVDELNEKLSTAAKVGDADEELDEQGNPKAKTGDEDEPTDEEKKQTADAMADTVSRAEILTPGFTVPTTDSVANLAAVATIQRKVLADAMKTADGKDVVAPLLGGRTIDALPADAVQTVFVAASELMRAKNNARGIVRGVQVKDGARPLVSNAEINKRNAEFWSKQ